jgi:4-amino-4-deoxy-L-arabinose transferase-like glycosyltransferase
MARGLEPITNNFTTIWAIYVKLISLNGEIIGIVTLLNSFILIIVTHMLIFKIFTNKIAFYTSIAISLTPIIFGFGLIMWHDVLMVAGLILLLNFSITYLTKKSLSNKLRLELFIGLLLASFRPNGIPTALLFLFSISLIIYFKKRIVDTSFLRIVFLISFVIVLLNILLSNIFAKQTLINTYFAQEWMRNDVSCFAASKYSEDFFQNYYIKKWDTELYASSEACTFLNKSKLVEKNDVDSTKIIPRVWLDILINKPSFILKTHFQRNNYLFPLPLYGLPQVPFLHSDIEFKNQGINWSNPEAANKVRNVIRVWNYGRSFFAWSGMWVLFTFIILRKRRWEIKLPVYLLLISNTFLIFIFAPIPDARYMATALIIGQFISIGFIIENIKKKFTN